MTKSGANAKIERFRRLVAEDRRKAIYELVELVYDDNEFVADELFRHHVGDSKFEPLCELTDEQLVDVYCDTHYELHDPSRWDDGDDR